MWFKRNHGTHDVPVSVVIGDFSDGRPEPTRGIRVLAISSIVIILSASASVYALSGHPKAQPTEPTTATQIVHASSSAGATSPSAPTVAGRVKTVASARSATPICTMGSDPAPTAISLGDGDSGVISRLDSGNTYRVYGNSTSEIWSQINRCSPVRSGGVFAGDTSYQLNYVYRFGVGSDGLCRVVSAAVSIHVAQVFPTWSPANGTPSSVINAWNSFSNGLHSHENGHVSIDNSYAQQMYAAMISSQPSASCSSLQAGVNATVGSLQSKLDAANETYDASTGHGRTQGAVL
jgi:predicted secreted Zn-dependent protease